MARRVISRFGPPPSTVAGRIKAERKRLGLTIAQAAAKLGVPPTTYGNLERAANPTLGTLAGLVGLGMRLRVIAPELLSAPPRP